MNTWLPSPPQLELSLGEVHVWSVSLDSYVQRADELAECLSPEELEQSQRFVSLPLTQNYIVSHAILRDILARYLHCNPGALKIANGEQGKPYLLDLPEGVKLEFNMSHTQGVALYAVSLQPVGVDIERLNRAMEVEDIAERFFSRREHEALLLLPVSQRQAAFYRCWTRKEAFIKALGQGLIYALDKFEVDFMSMKSNCLLSVESSVEQARVWSLWPIECSDEYAAAVALRGELKQLRCWNWCQASVSVAS